MSIRRDPSRALYQQVADAIRRDILNGGLPPGALLPSEKFLAETYEVGRDTIRDAMQLLRFEGLVTCKRGERSRVHEPGDRITLTLQPAEEVIARMPTQDEAQRLRLSPGEPLLELRRDGQITVYAAHRTALQGAWAPLP